MATPISKEADEARGYFARERRRKLQDLSAYKTAGFVPPDGTPFDFGVMAAGSISPNTLILPADVDITFEFSAAVLASQLGIFEITSNTLFQNGTVGQAGGRIEFNHVFIKDHEIQIFRSGGLVTAGTLIIYFAGPKSQLTQIGVATFT